MATPGELIRLRAKRSAAGKVRRVYVHRSVSQQLKNEGLEKLIAYDFARPFVDASQLPTYDALDVDEAREYGQTVRATAMSNAEYSERHKKFSGTRKMMPVPSHHRIFLGYLVIRKMGTKSEYETWIPDHVFEDLYIASPNAEK